MPDIFGKIREETVACDVHGPQAVRVVGFSDGTWSPAACPPCAEAKAQEEREAIARIQNAEAERLNRDRMARRLGQADIPPRFSGKTFAGYEVDTPDEAKALAVCRGYAEDFPANLRLGRSMVLFGKVGTGKTHLACAIINEVVTRFALHGRYMSLLAAIRSVKDTYSRESKRTEQQAIDALVKPDLLVLDEVGVQFGSDTERMIAFEIINARYEAMKPTILISNLDVDGLKECLGDRALDRLRENGGRLVMFEGNSKRGNA